MAASKKRAERGSMDTRAERGSMDTRAEPDGHLPSSCRIHDEKEIEAHENECRDDRRNRIPDPYPY